MKGLVVAVLFLCACDPVWRLEATVKSPADQPLENAAIVLTGCPEQDEQHSLNAATLTDKKGSGFIGGLGVDFPTCDITVAKPGYVSHETSFAELCGGSTKDCRRSKHIRVSLEPMPVPVPR